MYCCAKQPLSQCQIEIIIFRLKCLYKLKEFSLLYFSCVLFYQQSFKTCPKGFRSIHLFLFNTHQFAPSAESEMYIIGNDLVYLSLG